MQHSQRLDQRLRMLREEVRTMSREKERGERVWRERLQHCHRQLKAKEEEMSRQSQYFESFKTQLQQKLGQARDREQNLQNRIYTLEKQLLDFTVSAATGVAMFSSARITAGTVRRSDEQNRLPSIRGEGEGEEETKEERKKQWHLNIETDREERNEDADGRRNTTAKQASNELRLQGFIISLQEDLRVLLEREEDGMTERRLLMEQLQEAQESGHHWDCKLEEMKAELHQLRLSESSLKEENEELNEENQRLQQILRDAADQTPPLSIRTSESTCTSPGTGSPRWSPAFWSTNALLCTTAIEYNSPNKTLQPATDDKVLSQPAAVFTVNHKGAAERLKNTTKDSPAKTRTPHISVHHFHDSGSKLFSNPRSLSVTAERLSELNPGNLEEIPSEESNALREAFRSLGLGGDEDKQHEHLKVTLQETQEQLKALAQENAQLRKQVEAEQWPLEEQITVQSTYNGDDRFSLSPTHDDTDLESGQEDLVQALNRENRALADRIQELLAHVKHREEEITEAETHLRERISRLEEDEVRLEQENQEQGCLIAELTKKTEDDLNTIMDLQQKLITGQERSHTAGMSEKFPDSNLEVKANSLVAKVLQDYKTQTNPETARLTAPSSSDRQLQNSVCPTSQSDQGSVSVHSLKTKQDELTGSIKSLSEQQHELSQSVQTQIEEKQRLTRTVWTLKEEKDNVSQALIGLKCEKEQLGRIVCKLKDERDQFLRSTSSLKVENEQLANSLSVLQRDKLEIIESVSSCKEERDQIVQSLQGLEAESDQLSQTVLHLKQQKDKMTNSLKCLTEQRDQEELTARSKAEHDHLIKSINCLQEEKEKIQNSIGSLNEEEKQIKQTVESLREERENLQSMSIQANTEGRNHQQPLLNQAVAGKMKEIVTGNTDNTNQASNQKEIFLQQKTELQDLQLKLTKSQEELKQSVTEIKKLCGKLSLSEAKWEAAEKEMAEQTARLIDATNQMEDITKENEDLTMRVKELQNKLNGLRKAKSDALYLKEQIEKQHDILTSELKAKTVALDELNSEYIVLKQGQGSRDDPSNLLVSLRTRYNDTRAKYDALLKRKSQTDLDVAPLKAKLSCLVAKCQERNTLLAQMMKAMRRQGCLDPQLEQQVEHLLGDAALQDYAAAFTPDSNMPTRDCSDQFTREFIPTFQEYISRTKLDPSRSVITESVNKNSKPKSEDQHSQSVKTFLVFPGENPTISDSYGSTLKISPVKDQAGTQVSPPVPTKSGIINTAQLSPPSGSAPSTVKLRSHHLEMKNSFSGQSSVSETSQLRVPSCNRFTLNKRLSSPEKILNLHEELQKTLLSSFQSAESRGREQQSRRCQSLSLPADKIPPKSKNREQDDTFTHAHSLPASSAPAKDNLLVTTKSNKSTTLFQAVASRSADVALRSGVFTNPSLKANMFSASSLSVESTKGKCASGYGTSFQMPSTAPLPLISDPQNTPEAFTVSTTLTATNINTRSSDSETDADHTCDSFTLTASHSANSSPTRRSIMPTKELTAAPEQTPKPRTGAPVEVSSVDVIKRVGQSGLLIGWERPLLDELGCSNGTFVYGYRVLVNGDFHKSVMSSACTKCVLENVDLDVPVQISVQTLGSNGLRSNSVHTVYGTSNETEPH